MLQVKQSSTHDVISGIKKTVKTIHKVAGKIGPGVYRAVLRDTTRPVSIISEDGKRVWCNFWMSTPEYVYATFGKYIYHDYGCDVISVVVRDAVHHVIENSAMSGYCFLYSMMYLEQAKLNSLIVGRENYISYLIAGAVLASKFYEEFFSQNKEYCSLMHVILSDPKWAYLAAWEKGKLNRFYLTVLNQAERTLFKHLDYNVYITPEKLEENILKKL
jgi:hypothetical protein